MGRLGKLAAAAVLWSGMIGAAWAQEEGAQKEEGPEARVEPGGAAAPGSEKTGETGKGREIVIPAGLDEDLLPVELALQIALAAAELDGKTAELQEVARIALESAATDRQKAYVHLRIAQMYYQREDYPAAIDALKKGLPLADGDRGKESLYFEILTSLLAVYQKTGQVEESIPYHRIYREIVSAGVNPWERLPDTEDVLHKPSGIRLPHRLGIFTRTELAVYDETGRDAGGTYRAEGNPSPLLSVFLVAEFDEEAEAHFSSSLQLVLNRFPGAEVLSRGPFGVDTARGAVEGFVARVNVPGEGYSVGLGSDLYVVVRKGTLIKFRISFPAPERERIDAAMMEVLKAFDWP